jgi:hypothetical protein
VAKPDDQDPARRHLAAEKTDALVRQLWALDKMPKAGALLEMTRI